jgi:hypothetical protein
MTDAISADTAPRKRGRPPGRPASLIAPAVKKFEAAQRRVASLERRFQHQSEKLSDIQALLIEAGEERDELKAALEVQVNS